MSYVQFSFLLTKEGNNCFERGRGFSVKDYPVRNGMLSPMLIPGGEIKASHTKGKEIRIKEIGQMMMQGNKSKGGYGARFFSLFFFFFFRSLLLSCIEACFCAFCASVFSF